ncbi:MAG TPA: MFS transporter [Pseudonocardiaceae bacterium]
MSDRLTIPSSRTARIATSTVFALHAALFAAWTPYVPEVKTALGLHEGALGLALLGAPTGSMAAMLVVGFVLARWGSRKVVLAGLIAYALTGPLLGLVGSGGQLFAALAVWGAFQSTADMAMNTQAVTVEREYGRPIMSSFHAWWSLGAFLGAGVGALALGAGVTLLQELAVLGALIVLVAPLLVRCMRDGDQAEPGQHFALPWRQPGLLVLAWIGFTALLCEGAAADWSVLYLRESLQAPAQVAGAAYAVFAMSMFVGRALGDRWVQRFGERTLIRTLAALGAVGLAVALLVGHPLIAFVGLAALGVGLACMVPVVFSAAARVPGSHPGQSIAAVATTGWVGFLLGPPLIGNLAHATSLPLALGLLPLLCASVLPAARALR